MKKTLSLALLTPFLALADVIPGTWCHQYLDAREYADAHNLPLVYIWSSYERSGEKCHYCEELEAALDTATVDKWMSEKGFVFCETWAQNGQDVGERNEGAYKFASTAAGTAQKSVSAWPIVCLYWPKGSGFSATNFTGRSGKMLMKSGGLAEQFMKSVDFYFADYGKDPSGRFACGKTEFDRLEAEASTAAVEIPLTRTNDYAVAQETVDRLVATWSNGLTVTTEVTWAVGESERYVRLPLTGPFAVGQTVALKIVNALGETVDENQILMVADQANSPANPLWIGERTAETLQAGEWTMDFDAAKARSKARKALTLVMVGGSQWCPDCVNTDEYFIHTTAFSSWATENDVACVAIDVPMIGSDSPSLLSYGAVDCWWLKGVTSGAAYLSRHGVPFEGNGGTNATAVAARNDDLLNKDTLHGGLCRPECMDTSNPETTKFKTGIPCLILMNADGKICGRIYQFNNVSPTDPSAAEAYVQRLCELAVLSADPTEEVNRHWTTATDQACGLTVALNETRSTGSDISAVDTSDYWRLDGIGTSLRGTFTVQAARETATAGQSNAAFCLWKKSGTEATCVAQVTGNLFDGLTIADETVDAESEWFLQLEILADSEAFDLERATDSRVSYTLQATAVADPGTPAFVSTEQTVKEADVKKAGGVLEVRAVACREGGSTGVLTVPVEIDPSTTAERDRFALVDEIVTWADGDTADKVVRIAVYDDANADGTQDAVFRLGESVFVLTLVDNDKAAAGKLSISACDPVIAKGRTVIATEGTTVRIGVSRVDGSTGSVAGSLTSTAGVFEETPEFSWENREADVKWCALQLPTLLEAPSSGKVTVTLVPAAGTSVVSSSKKVDVQLVAVDAPAFAEEQVTLSATRYVALSRSVGLLNIDGLTGVQAKKLSGSLPSGVKVSVEGDKLVISGTPSAKAGAYSAVYQLTGKQNRTTVSGKTLSVGCYVTDFTALSVEDPGSNPAVTKGLTVSGLTMLDEATRSIAGQIASLSVNARGKLSAKYACPEGTIALKCAGWSSYDSGNGSLTAELTATKSAHRLTVAVARDGTVTAELFDPAWPTSNLEALCATDWASVSGGAADWQGLYTVDFYSPTVTNGNAAIAAIGDPVATLRMTAASDIKKGQVKYAVVLPNGRSISGSAVLVWSELEAAVLPIFKQSSGDMFFAAPRIQAGRPEKAIGDWSRVAPRWRHDESKTSEGSYEISYLTAGSAYDEKADLLQQAMEVQGTNLRLFVTDGFLEPASAMIGTKTVTVSAPAGSSLKLSLTKSSGLISGSFKFTDALGTSRSANFKGVLLPDWDGCPTCGERPWAAGSFWYSDKLQYVESGKEKSVTVKCGAAVMIEADLAQ